MLVLIDSRYVLFISESLLWAGTRAVGGEEKEEEERDERRRGGGEGSGRGTRTTADYCGRRQAAHTHPNSAINLSTQPHYT